MTSEELETIRKHVNEAKGYSLEEMRQLLNEVDILRDYLDDLSRRFSMWRDVYDL